MPNISELERQRLERREETMSISHGSEDFIIFSVYDNDAPTIDNERVHQTVAKMLEYKDVPYVELTGRYYGHSEESFLVPKQHEQLVERLALINNQICYMVVTPHKHGLRKAIFKYLNPIAEGVDEPEFKGYLREVSEEKAKANLEGYTYRPDVDKYWVIDDNDDTLMV